ncbi:MAG TPA: hypothetical protein VLG37_02970 [Candidatus Saccharimonadales bacterium]|nr:hypothetical protein [Candidatus Saccharimonadales bacterium]
MAKELVVVGIDKILWPGNLAAATLSEMEKSGWIGYEGPRKASTSTMIRRIAQVIGGRTEASVKAVTRQVAEDFVGQIDSATLARLEGFSAKRYRYVAMSSAPGFVVRQALERLRQENGLWVFDALNSDFPVHAGRYTGEYKLLDKYAAVCSLLDRTGMPNVTVGLINGISDLRWAQNLCASIEVVNPGERLSQMSPDLIKGLARAEA